MQRRRPFVLLALSLFLLIVSEFDPISLRHSVSRTFAEFAYAWTGRLYMPLIIRTNPPPPATTTSRYVVTTSLTSLNAAGCNQAQAGESGLVILDFGHPVYNSTTGEYGTHLLEWTNPYASFGDIEMLAEEFIQGYHACATTPGQRITVALGVNNHPRYGGVTPDHGRAWGQVVDDLVAYINYPPGLTDKISIAAAVDIEFQWNSPTPTRAWLNAYWPYYARPIYNFGSCDSCPWFGGTAWQPLNGWTYQDLYYVSYDAQLAWPFPEIYRTDSQNADQWYRVSRNTYTNPKGPMIFKGAMTRYACQDDPNANCHAAGTDSGLGLGWEQLWVALNADPITGRDLQYLQWSTDIRWNEQSVR